MRDRDLVRLHWPRALRPAFDALFAIDDAMAAVVAGATQPALAAIKLAWWRERLQELDEAKLPAEPRLQAATAQLLSRQISGAELAELEPGWAALLQPELDPNAIAGRGVLIFNLLARLLDTAAPPDDYGALFASIDVMRRGYGLPGARAPLRHRSPGPLRPLTALSVLAARDARLGVAEPEATPGRSWTLLKHRLTGR